MLSEYVEMRRCGGNLRTSGKANFSLKTLPHILQQKNFMGYWEKFYEIFPVLQRKNCFLKQTESIV